jgi:CTP:molybdopterin cytidylyltransferase MocA
MQVAALLAAGRSRRFGADDKLRADLGGRPLIVHAATALQAVEVDLRLLVTGSDVLAGLCPGFRAVPPEADDSGQAGSLRAAVLTASAVGAEGLLIALADMPCVGAAHLAAVTRQGMAGSGACSGHSGRRMPPAWFPASAFGELLRVEGDTGARTLLRAFPETAVVHAAARELTDVDTPEDLAVLRKIW